MAGYTIMTEEEYRKFYDWIAELANKPKEEGDNLRYKLRYFRPLLDQCNSLVRVSPAP